MPRKVLIVDDSAFVRKTLSALLSAAHYQVVGEAENGTRAVDLYFKLQPDIVTMDVVMPDLSGIEATRRIIKRDRDARIVVVSALGHEGIIMDAINAGAKDYVLKPFRNEDILRVLDHVLAQAAESA